MVSIYQGSDKNFTFTRMDVFGNVITSVPNRMWFTVKPKYEDEPFSFQKTLNKGIYQNSDGSWRVEVSASDTAALKPGDYVCDVKVQNESGKEYPIVKPQDFRILPVSTRRINQGG